MNSDSTRARIIGAEVTFLDRKLRTPLRLSSGVITVLTEARAQVRLRVSGQEETGHGSVYLSDVWAWPDARRCHKERDGRMRELCVMISQDLDGMLGGVSSHPLELGLRLHDAIGEYKVGKHGPPLLARLLCASPFDAAIHDAVGRALKKSAFALYEGSATIPSADWLFPGSSTMEAIREVLVPARRTLDAWWVVGRDDALSDEKAAITTGGYRCFKLKLLGNPREDAVWTGEAFRELESISPARPILSADANGAYSDEVAVGDYLDALASADGDAYGALRYIEQPTGWDLRTAAFDWRPVGRRVPVVVDEGLIDLNVLSEIEHQGWSGLALKTCKGHSMSLVAAAWGHARGLLLTMQDLTNPGFAGIHSALFAAHVGTVNGLELNSPQFTPDANNEWLPRLSGLFEPRDGTHHLVDPDTPGLGSLL